MKSSLSSNSLSDDETEKIKHSEYDFSRFNGGSSQNLQFVQTLRNDEMGPPPNLQYVNTAPIHNKEYEDAEIKLKIQEAHLKEAEIKLKIQEVELKKAQVLMKLEEASLKKQEASLKKQDIEVRKRDTLLKDEDIRMKKHEIRMKWLEAERYAQETKHHDIINKSIETSLVLKNLDSRMKIIHSIGLNFGSNTDFNTLVKMSELLGDSIPDHVIDDLKAVKNKITHDNQTAKSIYH